MAGVIHLDKKLCTKKQDGILEDAFRYLEWRRKSYKIPFFVFNPK